MRNSICSVIVTLSLLSYTADMSAADNVTTTKTFAPFTGKTTRNRVRIRTGADLNSSIVREVDQGTMLGVIGEEDTFYVVKPPKDLKGYMYRTYVLDNVVDGAQVNVRLEPSLDAPVIAQLNKGDRVDGNVSAVNSKWMEISLPETMRLYIAKEFVENVGPVDLLHAAHTRKQEASEFVNHAYLACQAELQKPAAEVSLERPLADLQQAAATYTDLPEEASRARNYAQVISESYAQKTKSSEEVGASDASNGSLEAMSGWFPNEAKLFEQWLSQNPEKTMDDFYLAQRENAVQLRGILQPYTRPVKNRPGNFLLISHHDHQPIAFLYSTQVDLQSKVGGVVSLVATTRPNNNFAFPAFFVISAE